MDVASTSPDKFQDWAVCPDTTQLQLQLAIEAGEAPLHCVGSLQVQHKLQLGFICGSLPVPTDLDVMTCKSNSVTEAAIVPAIGIENERVMAPRYRMLPNQTDLNSFFVSEVVDHDQLSPATMGRAPEGLQELGTAWGRSYHNQPLARKCEALAVSGLAGCGDQIDMIAPVDILKNIFKIPYSKARVSIAVHKVGQTLILNTGPDVNEGENLARAKRSQAKAKEKSLFLKFAMQSAVRAEACDCPVSQNVEEQSSSSKSLSSDSLGDLDGDCPDKHEHVHEWEFMVDDMVDKQKRASQSTRSINKGHRENDYEQRVSWSGSKDTDRVFGSDSRKKSSIIGEHQKDPDWIPNFSGNHKRTSSSEGFLRFLFWQLEEIRMLLGSDLLLFSNEKHVAVSLHLWETERQVTPLMWLDAWLDNVMASVPELAICYHHNGIVQGYELLKTDDIFLLKGLSKDGTSFFHPHVVQQNALSVLRFLQENCKEDLGTYWLFKNSGEDLVQLFDLSVISNKHTTSTKPEEKAASLPSSWNRGKGSSSLPLGILLYRLAHRLSLSQDPSDRCRCANFFKKCLELLGEQEHLFVRASAHEHVARLILKCYEELGSTLMPFLLEAKEDDNAPQETVSDPSPQTLDGEMCKSKSSISNFAVDSTGDRSDADTSVMIGKFDAFSCEKKDNDVAGKEVLESCAIGGTHTEGSCGPGSECSSASSGLETTSVQQKPAKVDITSVWDSANTLVALISARLTAVHHVSQAIKALRWQRQLQDIEGRVLTSESKVLGPNNYVHLVPVCVYGELDCIEYCDIRDCEIGPFMDQKLVQLVLLLGESYLALGQAYKDDGQLKQATKAAELACSVYQSMPVQYRHGNKDVSKNRKAHWAPITALQSSNLGVPKPPALRPHVTSQAFCQPVFNDSDVGICTDKCLFWGQAWILVGDIYVEYQRLQKDEKETPENNELAMAQEVAKEVKRLRKKFCQSRKSCSVCSTVSCSCESDRASSGNSASSSSCSGATSNQSRRHSKKANTQRYGDLDQLSTQSSSFSKMRGKDVVGGPIKQGLVCDIDEKCGMKPRKEDDTRSSAALDSMESKHAFDNADSSITTPREKDSGLNPRKQDDIFSYLQVAKHIGREDNLLVAVECYDAALLVLREMSHGSEEIKSALRKKGWAYNEIGRMKLACGSMKMAEPVFEKAIRAFKDVKDQTNVVLIYYNMAHGQRAVAEALVSQLDSWKSAGLFEHVWKKLFVDAATAYLEALRIYGLARKESRFPLEDLDSEKVNLCNEVLTQYAHTHLRLGMLLAREEKYGPSVLKVHAEALNNENGSSQNLHSERIRMTANEAIREAIALYGSLGSLREQELAFAQFQLACQHRDSCLAIIELEGEKPNDPALLQQSKRYLSLADRYWVKALKYYRCTTHPDMFLEIQMQRSDLNIAVASTSNSVSLLEVAFSHLLEGRNTLVPATTDSSTHVQDGLRPSGRVYDKLTNKLLYLLRTMLAAMQNLQKSGPNRNMTGGQTKSSQSVDSKRELHRLGQVGDAAKLKEMYRLALKSSDGPLDLNGMYNLWVL